LWERASQDCPLTLLGEGSPQCEPVEQIHQHAFRIPQYVIVPVSRDAKSFRPEQGVSLAIWFSVAVLTSVHLHDELSLEAYEIQNILSERDLSPKLDATQTPISQQEPKLALRVGGNASHCACILAQSRFDRLMVRCVSHGPLTHPSLLML